MEICLQGWMSWGGMDAVGDESSKTYVVNERRYCMRCSGGFAVRKN